MSDINFCKPGMMSVCTEKDNGWKMQHVCSFSDKSSHADRCMYCVHDELCDNHRAQDDARNPTPDSQIIDNLLEMDLDALEKELELDLEGESKEDSGPKPVLPDLLSPFITPTKGGA